MKLLLITIILVFANIYPIRWAAKYADAENTNYIPCFILSIVASVIYFVANKLLPGSTSMQGIITIIISVIICMNVLKIPTENFLMFTIMLAVYSVVVAIIVDSMVKGILYV